MTILGLLSAQQPPAAAQPKQMMKGKGMMQGDGAGKSMMAKHQEMAKLIHQVTVDLAALQKEGDLATLKHKLAADQILLEQVRDNMKQQQAAMGQMMGAAKTEPPTEQKSATDHDNHKH